VIPDPLILGVETSCDETAAAVVEGGTRVLSNVIATQHHLHEVYAGVVPEIASRAHVERILPVVRASLEESGVGLDDLDAIAVGHRPGLVGSLVVGVSAAKALAWSLGLPLIGVDHIAAHLHAVELNDRPIDRPAIGLVVSGGHTSLFLMPAEGGCTLLGRTIDDAAGEAFDKAATILELGYPGGPMIDRAAREGHDRAHVFPVTNLGRESLDFSFSGLKTALLYSVRGQPRRIGREHGYERDASSLSSREKADFAASFQRAVVSSVLINVQKAIDRHDVRSIVVGGGVSANSVLRAELARLSEAHQVAVRLPRPEYCVDNAAMIAGSAAERFRRGDFDDLALAAATNSALV
jgi:N6-L-threonylcarbamoyladenine synthase